MLRSMTGFGNATVSAGGHELSVELKSVNHKYCEVKVRLPRELSALEAGIVKTVKELVSRGAIDVAIRRQATSSSIGAPSVDFELAKSYLKALNSLRQELGLPENPTLRDVMVQPGVIRVQESEFDASVLEEPLQAAVRKAVGGLLKMRELEGAMLKADLDSRLVKIEQIAAEIEKISPKSVAEYRARLDTRLAELLGSEKVDPQRLAQEVALLADRVDITEELTRLRSHIAHFRKWMAGNEPSGRKLDFLTQELHREINTTASKSQHVEISPRVVEVKAELERIREQVQNIE